MTRDQINEMKFYIQKMEGLLVEMRKAVGQIDEKETEEDNKKLILK